MTGRPRWPMIVLRSPKGWTGPKMVDGLKVEGTFRAHQVPLLVDAAHPEHVAQLESWMRSYKAEELFDGNGRLIPELAALAPKGDRRMGVQPARQRRHAPARPAHARLPRPCGRRAVRRAPSAAQDTMVLGKFLRDVAVLNQEQRNFRIFGPDETLSNLLGAVFEVTAGNGTPARWPTTSSWRRTAACRRLDAERTPVRGLPGGLSADGPARAVQQLRGVHPHRGQHVQPAREMAEGDGGTALAAADLVAQLPARLPRLAAGPQRLHAPGSGLPRPRRQQEGRHRPLLPARRRQLPAVGVRSLPAQPPLRERRRRRQARAAAMADDGAGRHPLHRRARDLAMGQQRPGRGAGRGDGQLRRHADAGKPRRRLDPAPAPAGR